MNYVNAISPRLRSKLSPREARVESTIRLKLMETVQSLQEKLAFAKKQLKMEKGHRHKKESSFELKSWKESSSIEVP